LDAKDKQSVDEITAIVFLLSVAMPHTPHTVLRAKYVAGAAVCLSPRLLCAELSGAVRCVALRCRFEATATIFFEFLEKKVPCTTHHQSLFSASVDVLCCGLWWVAGG
jgi:hypothetical protein